MHNFLINCLLAVEASYKTLKNLQFNTELHF